jgi:translocation and assembly module TamB
MLSRCLIAAFAAITFYSILSAQAASLSISSTIDNVSYDLGFMHLSLEKIDSSIRISPDKNGKLLLENVNAKRLVITVAKPPSGATKSAGLPENIKLPFPIQLKSARIAEVLILNGDSRQSLTDVAFNLDADSGNLRLELVHAATPWGILASNVALKNARPFALQGNVQLKQADADYPYDIDLVLEGDLEQLELKTHALLAQQNLHTDKKQTTLLRESADVAPQDLLGKITLNASLGLKNDFPLDAKIQLIGFGPRAKDSQPTNDSMSGSGSSSKTTSTKTSMLNADLRLTGTLGPQTDLNIDIETVGSLWQGEAIKLKASAKWLGQAIEQIQLHASLKNNQLSAEGAVGRQHLPLTWQVKFEDISAFDPMLAGHFNAEGSLEGERDQLALKMEWLAERLYLNEIQIGKLSGNASLSQQQDGLLHADIHANDILIKKNTKFNASLSLRGTREKHQIEFTADAAADKASDHVAKKQLQTMLTGSYTEEQQWLAKIEKFSYQGDKPMALEHSADVQYHRVNGLKLENVALQLAGGHIYLDHLQHGNAQFSSRGRIASLGLAELPELLFKMPANISGNPIFSGSWDIVAANEVNGQANLKLESGDFSILSADGSIKPLGLDSLRTELQILQNNITLNSETSGAELGELNIALATQLNQTASGFAINKQAPLDITVDGNLKSLAWLPMPDAMAGALLDGQLTLSLRGKGTIDQPRLDGDLKGEHLSLMIPGEGLNLADGTLDAVFSDDLLLINQAKFHGGEGLLTATGSLKLAQGEPNLVLDWHAENFTATSRTDRLLVVEGDLNTTLSGKLFVATGHIEILHGLIELTGKDKPTLGDDVVIIGREEEAAAHPLQIKITDLKIGLGNTAGSQLVMRGRGLDSKLKGTIILNGLPNEALRAEGSIMAAGTYMAYGQALNIERGQLNFSGPVNNPGLNIRALRENMKVRAGVEIRGNVLNPAVKLISDPDVSDNEKLSWLVLGHGIDQANQDQFAILSLAAGALLSQGQSVPMQTRFAQAAGLDTLNVGGSDAETASISFGKRLASNLHLSYEKEISGLLNVARLTYDITKNWSIRTQAGSESAVDVLYTFSFK